MVLFHGKSFAVFVADILFSHDFTVGALEKVFFMFMCAFLLKWH